MNSKVYLNVFFTTICSLILPSSQIKAQFLKIESFPCQRPEKRKIGSGSIWLLEDNYYVLSSDHVLYHGTKEEGFCHRGQNETSNWDLEFVSANWSQGLALLKISPSSLKLETPARAFTVKDLAMSERGQNLEMAGFPFHSNELSLVSAKILLNNSTRHLLPKLLNVAEVLGHNEYGMSGGSLWDSKLGKFYGLISHQYLFQKLGAPPEIGDDRDLVDDSEPIALCVKAPQIQSWLSAVLQNKKSAKLIWNPNEQVTNLQSVVFEGLKFSRVNCTPTDSNSPGSLPVGGSGDGVGIGGSRPNQRTQFICQVQVETTHESGNPWPFQQRDIFEKLKVSVSRPPAKIYFSHFYDAHDKALLKIGDKLETFFMQWELGLRPLGKRESEHQDSNKLFKELEKLRTEITNLKQQLDFEKSKESAVLEFSSDLSSLISRLSVDDGYTVLSDDELKQAYENPVWSRLFQNYDLLVLSKLRSKIAELRELLNLIRA